MRPMGEWINKSLYVTTGDIIGIYVYVIVYGLFFFIGGLGVPLSQVMNNVYICTSRPGQSYIQE